ncbi:hypothetical protein M3Y97_01063700 [Aphelenchoides bicaudatus]|nr:hypothetical protein M3Y97_01063700 [Aphelenchoides bicaudatus]
MLNKIDDLSAYKMIIGIINISLGSFFVFVYFRYARKSSIRRENRKNFAVLLILITELLFTVLPNALHLTTNNAIIPVLQIRFATTVGIGYSSDAAVTTIVYWYTWHKIIMPNKVQPSVTVLNQPANVIPSGPTES